MSNIDENKGYKFSEVIDMLEGKLLPKRTQLRTLVGIYHNNRPDRHKGNFVVSSYIGGDLGLKREDGSSIEGITPHDINNLWYIELPKEELFYLKLPDYFKTAYAYLNYDKIEKKYMFVDSAETGEVKTKFTQSEIRKLPYEVCSITKPIRIEEDDENNWED